MTERRFPRRQPLPDPDVIREEVAERIEEATRATPTPMPPPQETTLPAHLIASIPPRAPQKPPDAPEAPPTTPGPSIAKPAVTAPNLGSYGTPSIDQHDALFVAAVAAVQRKKGVIVSPRFIKAVMGVESGEDGNYPVAKCRPFDGHPGPLSCGPMQIKWSFHEQRCRECSRTTLPGHIELATHIIGDTMKQYGYDEYRAYTKAYLTSDDINGTSQAEAVAGLRRRVGQMEANAGPGTPEPAPVPAGDPMLIITGGVLFNDAYGWRDRAGVDYSNFAPGHGTFAWDEHPGIDLIVPPGTRLYTPAAGVVGCVGEHGTPQPGRSCGYYEDDGGGPGNITIKLDDVPGAPTTWLTIGHCRTTTVRPGERVTAGQQIGTVGLAGGGWHPHVETSILKDGTYLLLDPRVALAPFLNGPSPVDPRAGLKRWDVEGTPNGIWLPDDITVVELLTDKGPNRQGLPLRPTSTVYHQTGNRGIGTNAAHHARWQRDGTPGHPNNKPGGPNIGVHAYTANRTVYITLPWNEQGIHSGDGRNQTALAFEECINADRDAALTERTTAHLHAAAIRDVIGDAAVSDEVTPHGCNHCPTIICLSGRWEQTEDIIRDLIGGTVGPVSAPIPYAPVSPLPIEWTGDDAIINGIRFTALHRVFRANADTVPALQYANPDALPVRRPLPKGEGFESLWLCTGDDGEPWLITRFWSRIPARLCLPRVEIIEDTGADVLTLTVAEEVVA